MQVHALASVASYFQYSTLPVLLLTEREGRTGEYWPEVLAVRTERSEVGTQTTEGQYSPVRLELARLVSSLLYGTRAMLVLNFPAFENKKYAAYDRFHGERKRDRKKSPPINSEQPEILFDSMVDDTNNPSIFVVYYDNQSYPEYLITI